MELFRRLRAFILFALSSLALGCSTPSSDAVAAAATRSEFITLGTQSGPAPSAARSQPSNLLRWRDQNILIDCGDGCAGQLAKAGVPLGAVQAVFVSHLHLDHVGGIYAFLGMRYQAMNSGPLTIYGPIGTQAMVTGFVAAMQPSAATLHRPAPSFHVVEIGDGSRIEIGDVVVTAASNSHFAIAAEDGEAGGASLSYRFDLPDRSIGITGDTGPSGSAERLMRGVDLLVSEIIDADAALAELQRARPDVSAPVLQMVRQHFTQQHLTPEQAGLFARRSGARQVIFTHIGMPDSAIERARSAVAENYQGPIVFAHDLARF